MTPTSSPKTRTRSSAASAWSSAWFMAWTIVRSAVATASATPSAATQRLPGAPLVGAHRGVDLLDDRLRSGLRRLVGLGDRGVELGPQLRHQGLLSLVRPGAQALQ